MSHRIDTSRSSYAPLSVQPKTDREMAQKANREGVPLWSVTVLHTPEAGKPEVITVTVPGTAAPALAPMQPATWTNLRVDIYQVGDSSGLYFMADNVSATSGGRE